MTKPPWLRALPSAVARSGRAERLLVADEQRVEMRAADGPGGGLSGNGTRDLHTGHQQHPELLRKRPCQLIRPQRPPLRSRACGLYSRCSVSETTSRPSRHASRTCTVGQTSPSEKTECRWRSAVRTWNPVGARHHKTLSALLCVSRRTQRERSRRRPTPALGSSADPSTAAIRWPDAIARFTSAVFAMCRSHDISAGRCPRAENADRGQARRGSQRHSRVIGTDQLAGPPAASRCALSRRSETIPVVLRADVVAAGDPEMDWTAADRACRGRPATTSRAAARTTRNRSAVTSPRTTSANPA